MKCQNGNEEDSMNTPQYLDSNRLMTWWNRQAITHPESAGILPMYDEPHFGLLYREEAEWLHFHRIVPLNKRMRVLELGCGAGRWTFRIAPLVSKVIGVDFSEDMVRLARKRQRGLVHNNVDFFVGAVQDSIWNTNFEVVYFSGITSYLNDPQLHQTLRHIQTILVPGGILIDRTSISLGEREVYDDGDYQGIYRTIQEQTAIFEEFGFQLKYRAPSYTRMRLPHCLIHNRYFRKCMEVGMRVLPKTGVLLIDAATHMMEKALPTTPDAGTRSHDFLVFKKRTHHI